MSNVKCITTVISNTEDGTITITNGEQRNCIIITVKNSDDEVSTIAITKKEFNNIVKLVNEKL